MHKQPELTCSVRAAALYMISPADGELFFLLRSVPKAELNRNTHIGKFSLSPARAIRGDLVPPVGTSRCQLFKKARADNPGGGHTAATLRTLPRSSPRCSAPPLRTRIYALLAPTSSIDETRLPVLKTATMATTTKKRDTHWFPGDLRWIKKLRCCFFASM